MALLQSQQLFSMSAKEETVCTFQEIVLAHCGFKTKDSSKSVVVIYRFFSANEAQVHKSALAFSQVPKMKCKLNPNTRASMFAPARKGRISCAVKSNAKNLRGLGKERRLIFLWLVLFSRRATGYEILTSSVYVFTTESHWPLAGHAPHVSRS